MKNNQLVQFYQICPQGCQYCAPSWRTEPSNDWLSGRYCEVSEGIQPEEATTTRSPQLLESNWLCISPAID